MTGHFITACGCECYKPIDFPAKQLYKFPTIYNSVPQSAGGWSTVYGVRTFKIESVDMDHAIATYREVQ